MSSASDHLHAATDEFNVVLAQLEAEVASWRLGVRAGVTLANGARLFYEKHKGSWGLFIETCDADKPKQRHITALTSASRETRVLVPGALHELMRLLDREVTKQREATQAAVALGYLFLAQLQLPVAVAPTAAPAAPAPAVRVSGTTVVIRRKR